jgi:hypothetical protein
MATHLPLKTRPKMDRWLRDRGLGAMALGERWGISRQAASRYLLPFGHPKRIIPKEDQIADAISWTRGEVVAADWYPPELSGRPLPASIGDLEPEARP